MLPSWFSASRPDAAVEIAAGRVSAARSAEGLARATAARESIAPGVVTPVLAGRNIHQPAVVTGAVRQVMERAGVAGARRVSLVVPDAVARVSLITLETVPARAAELDLLLRAHLKKSVPFPIDEAAVSHFQAHQDAQGTTFAAVAAHRAAIIEYESALESIGAHPGEVGVASLNVVDAVAAAGATPAGDWLLVCLSIDAITMAVMRGASLMSHRHRVASEAEPLGSLIHQTAMFYEDRLGGTRFERVLLADGRATGMADAARGDADRDAARREIGTQLPDVPVESVDLCLERRGAA
jgi:type IV pilus assembly protein PilM